MAKAGRPKKDPDAVKTEWIEMRVEKSEKDAFRDAAEAAGMALSVWIRLTLRKAAKRELESLNRVVPFMR